MKITHDNWPEQWDKVAPWTLVDDSVYAHFMNSVPPVSFRFDAFQAGEAYDAQEDGDGRWKNRYMTFADCGSDGKFYLGLRFRNDYPEKDTEAIKKAREAEQK